MALPSKELTWQYNVNQTIDVEASALITYQKMMFAIKESLVGFTNGWTVVGSSDTATYGMDTVDRWTS